MLFGATCAPMARPKRMARSTAPRLRTGSTPGSAMSTALAWRLGSAPKAVEAPEKILDAVFSWAWTSSPMTTSQVFWLMSVSSSRRDFGPAAVPVGDLLVAMRHIEQAGFVEMIADELQAHRHGVRAETAGQRHAWHAGEVDGDGVEVGQIPLHRVVGLRAEFPGGGRANRAGDHVAGLEGVGEVAGDEATQLLRLQVIGVVVAVREYVGADQDAPLDLGAEALAAALAVHVVQ